MKRKAKAKTSMPKMVMEPFTIANFLDRLRAVASQFEWVLEGGCAMRGWKDGKRACCPVSAIGGSYTMPITSLETMGMTTADAGCIVRAADGYGTGNIMPMLRSAVGL